MKKSKFSIVSLSALIALSACSEAGQDARQQAANGATVSDAKLTSYGKSLNQIGAYPSRAKFTSLQQNNAEIPKGTCTFESKAFTASAAHGKPVRLPSFGKNSPEMTVVCLIDGTERRATVGPVNLTAEAYRAQAAGHVLFGLGIVGAAVTGGIAANRDKSKDIYGYPLTVAVK